MDFSTGSSNNQSNSSSSIFTTGKTNMQNLQPVIKGNYGTVFYSSMNNKSNYINIESTGEGWTCSKTTG